jgi:hypothetical protein
LGWKICFLRFYVDGAWNQKKLRLVLKDGKFMCFDGISCFKRIIFFRMLYILWF